MKTQDNEWMVNRSEWMSRNEVKRHLRVGFPLLVERMSETPDHIESPWIELGNKTKNNGSGVRYRFKKDSVNDWWIAVNRWKFGKVPAAGVQS